MAEEIKKTEEDKSIPAWLAPILSTLGSMASSYMLWIKPLQERLDLFFNQLSELRQEVKELKEENRQLEKQIKKLTQRNDDDDGNFLSIKRSNHQLSGRSRF